VILCGPVPYYREHEPSKWLKMGILFLKVETGMEGSEPVRYKYDRSFIQYYALVRVGYTTWSGNERMISCW